MSVALKLAEIEVGFSNLERESHAVDMALQARERYDADLRLKVFALQQRALLIKEDVLAIKQMLAIQ
jgi:hypothetical protein